ncbi:MAG: damage-inducible protein CinA [Arcobacter sp.]|nr:MAG: damage-inducible protein CinA [Arcobacter sp.]
MYNDIFNLSDMINFQNILKENNQTITTAESCTGGLISSMITEISGSSSIFKGSIVTYSNEIKEQELDVKKSTMIQYGVVSCEVVKEMLIGVQKKFNSNFAIAVSGIAGPNGGTKKKPVGTVAIGVMSDTGIIKTNIFHFKGNRKGIQVQAAKMALKINFEILLKKT